MIILITFTCFLPGLLDYIVISIDYNKAEYPNIPYFCNE